jgi:hypothetical protein
MSFADVRVFFAHANMTSASRILGAWFDSSIGLAGHEAQPRDLRGGPQTLRRSPIAGAATRVDPQAVQPCETGREWLLETHKEIPREELAAVRVAG